MSNKGRDWKMPSCICSCQLCIKSEVCFSDCWKLRRLLEAATGCRRGPQYDWKWSFYFNCYFSVQLQQTEISDRKLFIFQHGFTCGSRCFTVYHNVLQVFHDVLWCLVNPATIGIGDHVAAIASGIATMPQGSTITRQESTITPQGSAITLYGSAITWQGSSISPWKTGKMLHFQGV